MIPFIMREIMSTLKVAKITISLIVLIAIVTSQLMRVKVTIQLLQDYTIRRLGMAVHRR